MINIRKLEAELWKSADELRAGSKISSNEYCMPVMGLIFLRYAYSRFKLVEKEILANRPSRGGRVMPVEPSDFSSKSAIFLPKEAQYDYLLNLPDDLSMVNPVDIDGNTMTSLGDVVSNAMKLIEQQSEILRGVLPKNYFIFNDELMRKLLRIFNNSAIDEVGGDIFGRVYEYFLNKFASNIAQDDGVFFTPKSLVKMIVNVIEPKGGKLLDPACGSGGMFIQTGDFVNNEGMNANTAMTFYGQEKVEYNAKLCLMNLAVHGLNGKIASGDEANTFFNDAHSLVGDCDYVMANPPFNVSNINSDNAARAGRLPFGLPSYNDKTKEIGNANYLWISYFYAYLNEQGRAGFVMAASATDSRSDRPIREELIKTGNLDVMVSVGTNFFYTKSLPCTLWFIDRGKQEQLKDKVLFIDARNYYTVVDRTLNEWSEWQLKNLNAIVWLYRGETDKYKALLKEYWAVINDFAESHDCWTWHETDYTSNPTFEGALQRIIPFKLHYNSEIAKLEAAIKATTKRNEKQELKEDLADFQAELDSILEVETIANEAIWLYEKFGDGEYHDIAGLCRCASISDIDGKEYSLNPGSYVGVAEAESDGVDFKTRLAEIKEELSVLQKESHELFESINDNLSTLL